MSDILITETTEDDEAWLYGEKVEEGKISLIEDVAKDLDPQEMLNENIVIKEQDTKPLDVDTDSGEDEEDDVQVTIRDIKANPTQYNYGFKGVPFNKPLAQLPSAKFNKLGSLDIEDVGKYNNIPIFDVNLEELEEKPWRKPGSDITDYFNYGFNEESWRIYCERQKALRADNETLDKIRHMYIPQPYYLHHIPSIDPANLSAQTGLLPHLNFPPPIIPSLINTESNQGTEEFESAKTNELSAESNKENAVDLADEGKVKREDDFTDHSEFETEEKINKSIDDHHQPSSTSTKTSGPLLEAPAASSMSSVTSMTPHHVLLAGQPLFQKTSTPAEAAAVAAKLSLPPGVNPFTVPPPGYPLLPTPDGRYNLPPPPFGGAPLPYIPGLPPLWPPPTGLPPVVISSSSGAAIGDKVSGGDRRNNSPPTTDSRRPAPYHHYPYYKPRDQQHGAYYGGGGSYHPQPYYKKTTPYGHPGGPPSKYYHQDNDEYYRRPGRGRYGGGGYKPHYASRYDDYYEETGADASGDDRRRPHYRHHRNEKGGGEEETGRPQGEIDSANPAGSSLDGGPDNNQNRYGKEDSESIVVKHNRPLIDSARLEGGPSDQVPSDQQASLSTEDKFSASSRHASYYPSRRGAPGGGYPNSEYYYGKSSYDRYPENERDYRRKPYDSRIRSSRHKEGEDRSGSKRKHRRYSKERRTKQRTRSKSRSNKSSDEEETSAPRESNKRHKRRSSPSPTRKKDKHHHSKKEDEDDGATLEDETSLSFANDLTSRGDVKSSKDQNTEQSRLDAGDESSRSSASSYRGDGVGDGRGGAGGGGEEDEDTKSDAAAVTPQGLDEKSIEGETTAPPKKSTKGGHHRKRSHRRDEKKSKRRAGGKHYHHKKSSGHRRRDRSRSTTATSRAGKRAKKERSDYSRSRSNSNESRYSSARKRDKKYSHYDDIYDEKPISSAPIIDKSSLKR